DIMAVVTDRPYSVYLYVGVELGAGRSASVLLIGYFDEHSCRSVVKLLHTLQMSTDSADPRQPKDTDVVAHVANSDAWLLVEALRKYELPLSNLVAFYSSAPQPGLSRVFVSQLQAFSPKLLSLCSIPGIAERTCQAGLTAAFSHAIDLITDVHCHYSICPSINGSLKEVFANTGPHLPQYLFLAHSVQKMAARWQDLREYFKSLNEAEASIRSRLLDDAVRLQFLFLSHALEPLRELNELQRAGIAELSMELQLTSILMESYTASICQPHAVDRFLLEVSTYRIAYRAGQLPVTEVNVGTRASDFMLAFGPSLGEQNLARFLKDAQAFYRAALQSLVESIPGPLGDVALRNIGLVLKNPESITEKHFPWEVLPVMAVQLGLCAAGPPEVELQRSCCDFRKLIQEQSSSDECSSWVKILDKMKPWPTLHRLFLTLLALPSSLHQTQVFAKVSCYIKHIEFTFNQAFGCQKVKVKHDESSSEDDKSPAAKPLIYKKMRHNRSVDDMDYTDNSSGWVLSDVIDITEEPVKSPAGQRTKTSKTINGEFIFIVTSDEEDQSWDSTTKLPGCEEKSVDWYFQTNSENTSQQQLANTWWNWTGVSKGELVWGQIEGFSPWPGVVVPFKDQVHRPQKRMVEWYGQRMCSQVSLQSLKPFAAFSQYFCANSFATLVTYREAVLLSLQEAAMRCGKKFSPLLQDSEEVLKQVLDWAFGGFQPTGPDGLKPKQDYSVCVFQVLLKHTPGQRLSCAPRDPPSSSKTNGETGSGSAGKRSKPPTPYSGKQGKRKRSYTKYTKTYNKVNVTSGVYTQPDQKLREKTINQILDLSLDIEDFCLCCGTKEIEISHPLFKGSLCLKCKDNFTETLYRYDEDGYQSYCTICCYGMEVILCGHDGCHRSFCEDCLNILVGPRTFDSLKVVDPWICYLCQPHQPHGALVPREDWRFRVQEMFANNSAMEFEPHRVYPSVPTAMRRPLRVLSLFDGIGTGYLVLKELGFKVEKYVASEVCEDSVAVATINHDAKIIHVGDVRFISQELLEKWGPFDLLIGGSPCNDLSIVNPLRKGLYEGTGRLFFEFYRILQLLKPKGDDERPFFWLFENVVFMNTHDKVNICRFLECNPVLVDAVKVSPAHRARYFWGNIPGMSRPIIASQNDKLNLQDCLELGREARVTKVRTITTNPNSLKQGKDVSLLPVMQNGREDILWITELEKIFGFPKHYTDARNMNRQQRQKLLGKAWSVPVIRHLFAPLKEYFACDELPPIAAACVSTASTAPSSPNSPDLQQLR
uniref:DNA (cytosine-5-)-methyltransferase n=1 Tax=Poecilia formosa TaxID=48698 RepID=A0A087XZA5_POEFO